jgi:C4-type Zn-finger protein
MISQRCPKCSSTRVRSGYRPTPLWFKLLFRYNLLCNNCNWEFNGFAVPGTVSSKPRRSTKKQLEFATSVKKDDPETVEKNKKFFSESGQIRIKKRVKIRL